MATSTDQISAHEVRLLLAFRAKADAWLTNQEVADAASVSPRTARAHTARWVDLGVLVAQQVSPARKFRLSQQAGEEGRAYLERWEQAREAHGL